MELKEYLGLTPTGDPLCWQMELRPSALAPGGFLMGGAGFAACLVALEAVTGRPVVWGSCHFASLAYPPALLDVRVDVLHVGRVTTQASAMLLHGDQRVLSVEAATGRLDQGYGGRWIERSQVPRPEDCPVLRIQGGSESRVSLTSFLEVRRARGRRVEELDGTPGTGSTSLWVNVHALDGPMTVAEVALAGDMVAAEVGQALGVDVSGNSIDNELRIVEVVDTEWIQVDVQLHAVHRSLGHAAASLWAQDGTLLAMAAQTVVARDMDRATERKWGTEA